MFTEEAIKARLSRKDIVDPMVERFVRYVKVETTSDSSVANKKPTTDCQFDLARILLQEVKDLGLDATVDEFGFVIGVLPATDDYEKSLTTLLIAHMDTSEACSGKDVKPNFHYNYDGGKIDVGNGVVIDPKESPGLNNCIHDTIITSDGSTLLGADDKAGIAVIMTALDHYIKNKIAHGKIIVMFNTDEETGGGMGNVPLDKIKSDVSITVDSTNAPIIEAECFNAKKATIVFKGFSVHPGYARGKLVNAASMAAQFITMIPRTEVPESTDGDYGYFYVSSVSGDTEEAKVVVNLRDFTNEGMESRVERIKKLCEATEAIFPGGKVDCEIVEQYLNMIYKMREDSRSLVLLRKAVADSIGTIEEHKIRGGTDGSKLTELGIPTPNLFTGGDNLHSRSEYASVSQMVASAQVVISLIKLASEEK